MEEGSTSLFANPEFLKHSFLYLQVALGIGFIAFVLWKIGRGPESAFRVREADRQRKAGTKQKGPDLLADARLRPESQSKRTLALDGIRIDGAPHEILGVREDATKSEIQKAYRQLMVRYHPDRVGPPGSREWEDSQRIAEAINSAKDHLLSRAKR